MKVNNPTPYQRTAKESREAEKVMYAHSQPTCYMCGEVYTRNRSFFPVSYQKLHKAVGFLPICTSCFNELYKFYLSQGVTPAAAVRQLCRKLDLYWSPAVFQNVVKVVTEDKLAMKYLEKINAVRFAGKSYDDTLSEEGTLWGFGAFQGAYLPAPPQETPSGNLPMQSTNNDSKESDVDDGLGSIDKSIVDFWGPGYTAEMYRELQDRYEFWISKFPSVDDIDIGTEALLRQVVNLEIEINNCRVSGRPVSTQVTALNNLIGSLNLKPTQKKEDEAAANLDGTPMGVWLQKIEKTRPIKEVDEDFKDVDGIRKFVTVWFFGHACKSLGVKNVYSRLYEEEIERLKVQHPEYADEDDDDFLNDIFGKKDGD